jgi:quercetin dioxygenase-like cupin family protein
MAAPRRVIAGLNAQGQSCIVIDGASDTVIWSTDDVPADNSGTADTGADMFYFPETGTNISWHDFPPHSQSGMHATNTIDYIVVLSGQVTFITETSETVLRAGDVIVDRGVMHDWRNDSDQPCRIVNVMVPAHPLGRTKTIAGKFKTR